MKLKTWIFFGLLGACMVSNIAMAQETTDSAQSSSLPNAAPVYDENSPSDAPLDIPSAQMTDLDDPALQNDPEGDVIYTDEYVYEEDGVAREDEDEEGYVPELELLPDSEEAKLPNPTYVVQNIRVTGNTQTSSSRILKMLGIQNDSEITLDELEEARIRLAMSGIFNSVNMSLRPGKTRGSIVIVLHVSERSHLQFNQYTIGSSYKSPFWLGLDVTYLAPFATDHRFRMAFGATTSNDYTLSMNYLIPAIAHKPVSLIFSVQSLRSHEDIYGSSLYRDDYNSVTDKVNPYERLDDLDFERHGASIGVGYAPHQLVRLMFRVEYMNLLRQFDPYSANPELYVNTVMPMLDDFMKSGHSNLTTIDANIVYDSRFGRILPNKGHFIMLGIKGTAKTAASDYAYFKLSLAHQSNFRVAPHHIIRLNTFLGASYGDTPFFEKFFFNDFYSLSPSRFFMLNPSRRGAYDLFKTGASGLSYEDFIGHIALTYAWQPFERMMEVFVMLGATWADSLEDTSLKIGTEPRQNRDEFPADMSFNLGIRFKTDYGLFSITLSNFFDLVVR